MFRLNRYTDIAAIADTKKATLLFPLFKQSYKPKKHNNYNILKDFLTLFLVLNRFWVRIRSSQLRIQHNLE